MTTFWLNNPNILFKSDEISHIWPSVDMSFEAKLNSITRLVILLTLVGYLITKNSKIVLSGLVTLAAIVLLYKLKMKNKKEGFTNQQLYTILKTDFTEPTVANPGMNVLLTEINDNPHRKEAAPAFNPIVEANINEKTKQFVVNNFDDPAIEERLFNDLGDNFTFDQSMRAFNPMPSTTIPNDQAAFTEYCYGDMIACRDIEGNELACVRNSPPRWTNY
jgi:hypothetical protein